MKVRHLCELYFDLINPLDTFPRVKYMAISEVEGTDYNLSAADKGGDRSTLFQFVLRGSMGFDNRVNEVLLRRGSGFLVNVDNRKYRYFFPDQSTEKLEVFWIQITGEAFYNSVEEINNSYGFVFSLNPDQGFIKRMTDYVQKAHSKTDRMKISQSDNSAIAFALLTEITAAAAKTAVSTAEENILERAFAVLEKNSSRLFTAQCLAEKTGISREHLTRIFSKQLRVSPYRYIIGQKIDKAKNDLVFTPISVKEIAHTLGFTSASHFCDVFRKQTGFTPNQYRRKANQGNANF